jgi:hypothetical protein
MGRAIIDGTRETMAALVSRYLSFGMLAVKGSTIQ